LPQKQALALDFLEIPNEEETKNIAAVIKGANEKAMNDYLRVLFF
jgi:hypothetical protein